MGSNLGAPGGPTNHLLGHLVGSWGKLGPTWPTWANLGQLGANLGPTWANLGPTWDQLGVILGLLTCYFAHHFALVLCIVLCMYLGLIFLYQLSNCPAGPSATVPRIIWSGSQQTNKHRLTIQQTSNPRHKLTENLTNHLPKSFINYLTKH